MAACGADEAEAAFLASIRAGGYLCSMGIPVEKLTEAVLALPADARALLADRLAESLDPLVDDEIRGLWVDEAVRRRDEVRTGRVQTISADAALRLARQSLQK